MSVSGETSVGIMRAVGASLEEGKKHIVPRSLIISPNLDALLAHEERTRGIASPTSAAPQSPTFTTNDVPTIESIGLPPPPRGPRRVRRTSRSPAPPTPTGLAMSPQIPFFFGIEEAAHEHSNEAVASVPTSPVEAVNPSAPNPYINPAPSLDEILEAEKQAKQATLPRPPPTTVNVLSRIQEGETTYYGPVSTMTNSDTDRDNDSLRQAIRPRDDPTPVITPPRTQSPDGRKTRNDDSKQPLASHISQQSQSKYPALPRVDKFLSITSISKNPFGRFSDSGTQVKDADSVYKSLAGVTKASSSPTAGRGDTSPPLPLLRERRRSKGKLVKRHSNEGSKSPTEGMHRVHGSTVLDVRRQETVEDMEFDVANSNVSKVEIPWRRRPLLSHASSSSRSSSGSMDMLSDSTHEPASTEEHDPRISISSTIYSPSSAHSHPHSMYSSTESPSATSPTRRRYSTDAHPPNQERHSFIEILSPSGPEFVFNDRTTRHSKPPFEAHSPLSARANSQPPKPPIPTTPKPVFIRPLPAKSGLSRQSSPKDRSPATSIHDDYTQPIPPTTNFLDMDERADLIRKSRKLARVFGQTPGAEAMAQQDCGRLTPHSLSDRSRHHHRGALSISNSLDKSGSRQNILTIVPFPENGRRHSLPASPDEMSFLSIASPTHDAKPVSTAEQIQQAQESRSSDDLSVHHAADLIERGSRTSFIDLSDEENQLDDGNTMTPKKAGIRRPSSPSTQSLFENMSPEEQAEEERRRKRDKLAKLHRFLGSRVPANLVLGLENVDASLPPVEESVMNAPIPAQSPEDASRKAWLRRRRSSSAAVFPSTWTDDLDRMGDTLDDKEKAINVRRAQKMEKVFGVAPPQTLYHTRHSPSPSVTNKPTSTSANPVGDILTPSIQRNLNRSAYMKPKSKKSDRPGTAESSKALLPKDQASSARHSLVYNHYQHSLNSLHDIIDRDDKESLAELHQYLSGGELSPPLQEFTRVSERRISNASIKSERRRSLPARTSMISIASEYSITSPKPEITDFQLRRRRAAKLTQFFGVDYRELINDVLESIELGLEHERKRGTLRAEEAEDLLERLRDLRTKRQGIF